jgi:hypothetical protein
VATNKEKGASVTEIVKFRVFHMPCCGQLLCWVNPRLPSFCPECGTSVYLELNSKDRKHIKLWDDHAQLKFTEGALY